MTITKIRILHLVCAIRLDLIMLYGTHIYEKTLEALNTTNESDKTCTQSERAAIQVKTEGVQTTCTNIIPTGDFVEM